MQLYLVRHPQPLRWRGLCYGRTDLAIAAHSITAGAAEIRSRIPADAWAGAAIFTSPLRRCRALAAALCGSQEFRIADGLLEMDFGTWEGRRWDSVPRDELDAWADDLWGYRPGGGESAAMVAERWRRWREDARRAGPTVIAVTHAGVIRVALADAGRSSAEEFARGSIAFNSVHRLDGGASARHAQAAS